MSDLQTCHDYLFIAIYSNFHSNKPRGKESTELRKSQIKGKESENSYQELKRLRKGQAHTETESRYFNWHGRLPQSKESKCL